MNYDVENQELRKIFNHYIQLANKKVFWAQTWIAEAYFWGWGVEKNFDLFIEWDTEAARNGSKISICRMLMYYLSIGQFDTVNSICLHDYFYWSRLRRILLPEEYSSDIKFREIESMVLDVSFEYFNNYLLDWLCPENLKDAYNNNFIETLDLCKNRIDSIFSSDSEWLKESSYNLLYIFKLICYIYGFGIEQNLQYAMKLILENDSNLKDEDKELYYFANSIYYHFYWFLREAGIAENKIIQNKHLNSYFEVSEEGLSEAYHIRHIIRWALEGKADYFSLFGKLLLEKNDNVKTSGRRLVYHDDRCALSYLKLTAGLKLNDETIIALDLASDPEKKTFDYEYANSLSIRIEQKLIEYDSDTNRSIIEIDIKFIRWHTIETLIKLASFATEADTKQNIANRAIIIAKLGFCGFEESSYCLARIYEDYFRDYAKALQYYLQWDESGENWRIKECKLKMNNSTSTKDKRSYSQRKPNPANNTNVNSNNVVMPSVEQSNGLATASLVAGVLGLFTCLPSAIIALILAGCDKAQGSRSSLSTVGLILGGIGTLFSIICWIMLFR